MLRLCFDNIRVTSRIIFDASLIILLRNVYVITAEGSNNATDDGFPSILSCDVINGVIPYAFNFYSLTPKRLISLVRKGHDYIEERSCLVFKEHNPVTIARMINSTYLFYSYSDVLESCCLPLFSKLCGRRLVLITPMCTLPVEVAHATLHGLGLFHPKREPFDKEEVRSILFANTCHGDKQKKATFESNML